MSEEPTKTKSEEVDRTHLEAAAAEGDAYQRSLRHMIDAVAHSGGSKRAGEYVVGYAQEPAEGLYEMRDGELEWVEPTDENCHIEVSVSDAADGRFVPHLAVEATLVAEDGEEVGPFELPFLWHPGLYHYGRNLAVPGDGRYTLRVRIDPPTFPRHDRENGRRYDERVEVTFDDVGVETGRK